MRYQNLSKNLTFSQPFLGRVLHPELIFLKKSERQDLNLRPLPPQGSTLPSCATSRFVVFRTRDAWLLRYQVPLTNDT